MEVVANRLRGETAAFDIKDNDGEYALPFRQVGGVDS
jgi:hypothetical protein